MDPVFIANMFEPFDGMIYQILKPLFYFLHLIFNTFNMTISLKSIVGRDTFYSYFSKMNDIFVGNFAMQEMKEGFQSFLNGTDGFFETFTLPDLEINFFFDEYFFQWTVVPVVFQLVKPD